MMIFKYIKAILNREFGYVLIWLNSGLGNSVQAIPAILELRRLRPDLKIVIAGLQGNVELLKTPEIGDEFYIVPSDRSLLQHIFLYESELIRNYRYIFSFLSNSPAGLIFLKKVGLAKHIVSVLDKSNRHYSNDITIDYSSEINEAKTNLLLLSAAGISGAKMRSANLFISQKESGIAKQWLAKNVNLAPKKFALIHPGWGKKQFLKRLGPEMVQELILKLKPFYDDVVLLLGPEENEYADSLEDVSFSGCKIISEQFSMRILASVLSLASVVISADTGPGHIASATGTPVVTCFGPTSWKRCASSGFGRQIIVTADLKVGCFMCEEDDTNKSHCCDRSCVNGIVVDDVVKKALLLTGNKILENQNENCICK